MDPLITDPCEAHWGFCKAQCANVPGPWPSDMLWGPGSCHLPRLSPADNTPRPLHHSSHTHTGVGLHQHVQGLYQDWRR